MKEQPNYDLATREAFYNLYVASRRPEVRALFNKPATASMDPIARQKRCASLAAQGYVIDPQIDTGLYDPYSENARALQFGFMTRPKMGEVVPFCTPPGDSAPNIPNYNEFTFSIKSSLAPVDYPANTEPDIVPTKYVGLRANAEGDYDGINLHFVDGTAVADDDPKKIFAVGDHIVENHVEYELKVAAQPCWKYVGQA